VSKKLPAFQFYPGDWYRDGICGCSMEAQGLWLRLMMIMHDSDDYGHLSHKGKAIPESNLARRCGTELGEFKSIMKELDECSIIIRNENGVIYSKRMVSDDKKRSQTNTRVTRHRNANVTHGETHLYEDENEDENENENKDINTKKVEKKKYGEFKNVRLTDEEYEKLKIRFRDIDEIIKKLDEGIEMKGYKYKSHYLAIIKVWAKEGRGILTNQEKNLKALEAFANG
jgi:hypothetical protein